ncbi:hypothetical protein CN917_14195 [Bacillus thuringiensis]|uniref:Group-specific protein n=11 Tax=Bacillus cereus group TaxID=86661 RepID=A0A9X6TVH1_BACTU|nr:hypothetical protein CAB88_18730 [Bacillus thuringiensis]AUB63220.1 hypothetical protein CSW12_09205 [Bacillus cereus]EEM33964.1 hypothetical protein bthur0003_34720 [Bacillus thuringiensis serovar thuringiensis str. T01001]EEM64876.1 hypothetical protein bthur0008_34380 [Bacillus thuringiensis serovar berliner ATCC 10792]OTW37769.1 hypothetical protein BK698_30170 [Bacillus thuringiensis serovar thuringiensis]OTW50417.1 hypothetical protein BK703_29600 [Bacillus thuringiensis serovar silo]
MTFYTKASKMVKKEGGMMMEEYVLELYNLLYTTEWQDIVSFLGIVFCMKIVIVYMEEQGMFYSFSSPFDVQREPLLNYANVNYEQFPFVVFFMIRFITAIVKKKESDDEECHATCKVANVF